MFEAQNTQLRRGSKNSFLKLLVFYKGNWVLDVGSNIGTFIDCTSDEFPDASILAFEPVKRYYRYTVKKFKDKENILIENSALGDEEKDALIHVAKNNIGWNTMIEDMSDEDNNRTIEKVKTVRFDQYIDCIEMDEIFDIVKIDTEGYESKVLNGMRHFLRDQKPTIVCEVAWGIEHPHWEEELEAFEFLYHLGYDSFPKREKLLELNHTMDFIFSTQSEILDKNYET